MNESLQKAQERYDNLQPVAGTIPAGTIGFVHADAVGEWPHMTVNYSTFDDSDEDGKKVGLKIESAMIGNLDMLEYLHEGAKEQLHDDVMDYLRGMWL